MDDFGKQAEIKMQKGIEAFRKNLSGIRTRIQSKVLRRHLRINIVNVPAHGRFWIVSPKRKGA